LRKGSRTWSLSSKESKNDCMPNFSALMMSSSF
jgi:hypothetical protein